MRRALLVAAGVLALSACDRLPSPPEVPARSVGVQLALMDDPTGVFAALLAQVNGVHVELLAAGRSVLDTVIALPQSDPAIRLRLAIGPHDPADALEVRVELRRHAAVLFEGRGEVTRVGASALATVTALPVLRDIGVRSPPRFYDALLDTVDLPAATAVVGTGERIELPTTWTSQHPAIAQVVGNRIAVIRRNGDTHLVARFLDRTVSHPITVLQLPSRVTGLRPTSATLRVGEVVQFALDGADRLGNPIDFGADVSWWDFDHEMLWAHSQGFVMGRCPGTTTVKEFYGHRATITVVAAPAPGMEFFWTRGDVGLVSGDATAAYRALGQPGATQPTRAPGTQRIAYVVGGRLFITEGGAAARTLPTGALAVSWPEFSSDGAWIYFGGVESGRPSRIFRIRPDGSGLAPVSPEGREAEMPTTSPAGDRVAYVSGSALMVQPIGGAPAPIGGVASPHTPRWSPDGRWIAYVETEHGEPFQRTAKIRLVSPDGAARQVMESYPDLADPGLTWSPDSRHLLAFGEEDYAALIHMEGGWGAALCWTADSQGAAWWR